MKLSLERKTAESNQKEEEIKRLQSWYCYTSWNSDILKKEKKNKFIKANVKVFKN